MRLYEITYNGRKWETTNGDEAFDFCKLYADWSVMNGSYWGEVQTTHFKCGMIYKCKPYKEEEIPNIQVA